MKNIFNRLNALRYLIPSLSLTFAGVVLLSLGVAYLFIHAYRTIEGLPDVVWWLTLQFLPRPWRGVLLLGAGLAILAGGIWQLSGVVVIPRPSQLPANNELVLGYDELFSPNRDYIRWRRHAGIVESERTGRPDDLHRSDHRSSRVLLSGVGIAQSTKCLLRGANADASRSHC